MIGVLFVTALTASAVPPAAVVRSAFGTNAYLDSRAPDHARPGDLLGRRDRLETSATGYAEVVLGRSARLRLSALTRLQVRGGDVFRLGSGRVWIQTAGDAVSIELGTARTIVAPSSSVVVERAPTGITVASRAGRATLVVRDKQLDVPPGRIATAAERFGAVPMVRTGGRALWDMVVRESRTSLGDLGGVERFVVRRALTPRRLVDAAALGDAPFEAYRDRISGADGGAAGEAFEDAIRPPPFFDDEVPPKGPNVRVDVTFSEE